MLISFVRTILLYIVIVAAMRLLGKRQIGELEPSELAITILLSELAAIPMQDPAQPLTSGLIPMLVLLALGFLTSIVAVASPLMRRILFGKPSIIIENGKLNQKEIRRLRLSVDELAEIARMQRHRELGAQANNQPWTQEAVSSEPEEGEEETEEEAPPMIAPPGWEAALRSFPPRIFISPGAWPAGKMPSSG